LPSSIFLKSINWFTSLKSRMVFFFTISNCDLTGI
jgi:hypothetical protein